MGKWKELAMEEQEKKWEFSEEEHKGGQHQTFQENCPACFSENLRIHEHNERALKKFNPLNWNNPHVE